MLWDPYLSTMSGIPVSLPASHHFIIPYHPLFISFSLQPCYCLKSTSSGTAPSPWTKKTPTKPDWRPISHTIILIKTQTQQSRIDNKHKHKHNHFIDPFFFPFGSTTKPDRVRSEISDRRPTDLWWSIGGPRLGHRWPRRALRWCIGLRLRLRPICELFVRWVTFLQRNGFWEVQ